MCFSAQASFIAATTLAIIGAAIIRNIKYKQQWWLAVIPFMFAIQQALEGIVWITLKHHDTTSTLHHIGVYGFVFFALVVWTAYVPIALFRIEPNAQRKLWLYVNMIVGCCLSLLLAFAYIIWGVVAYITHDHHIFYTYSNYPTAHIIPFVYDLIVLVYIFVTVGSMYISSIPYMRLMGIITGISCVIAYVWYYTTFGSVWCFFAAIISGMIYYSINAWNNINFRV